MAKSKSTIELAKNLYSKDKRRAIRFEPDPGTIAWIDTRDSKSRSAFSAQEPALIMEESEKGCGLAMKECNTLKVGGTCRVKVGNMNPVRAEIRWITHIDSQVIRVGLMYIVS